MNHRHSYDQLRAQTFSNTMESLFGSWQTQVTKSSLRIGDAERSAAAQQLGEHFASGRLERWEYDERVDAALAARTRGDLAQVFRDLPDVAVPVPRPSQPRRRPGGLRLPVFPLMLILIGVAVVTDSWWILLVGLGVVILLRRAGAARCARQDWRSRG